MTDSWKLPDGKVVDEDGLYDHLTDIVDDDYAVDYLNDAYPEIDVCGHSYPAGKVARSTWDDVMWASLKEDITDGLFVDRYYGSLEEFGVKPIDAECPNSSDDSIETAVAEGGQD